MGTNNKCISTIRWYSNNYPDLKVTVKGVPNSNFATGPIGKQDADWITSAGAGFELRDSSSNTVLTETQVIAPSGSQSSPTPSSIPDLYPSPSVSQFSGTFIQAAPNPCVLDTTNQCHSKIDWSYPNANNVRIAIKGAPGSAFGTGPTNSNTATWINADGVTFELYADGVLKDELYVRGVPVNTIVASPANCSLNGASTCTLKLWWHYPGKTDLEIRVKENPGSVVAKGYYGTQTITWLSATGATFEAYSGGSKLGELFVRGVTANVPSIAPSPSPSRSPLPTESGRVGDFDNDGDVDLTDFNTFLGLYRSRDSRANLNLDNAINILDFNTMVGALRNIH
jgi:hypothetical protein